MFFLPLPVRSTVSYHRKHSLPIRYSLSGTINSAKKSEKYHQKSTYVFVNISVLEYVTVFVDIFVRYSHFDWNMLTFGRKEVQERRWTAPFHIPTSTGRDYEWNTTILDIPIGSTRPRLQHILSTAREGKGWGESFAVQSSRDDYIIDFIKACAMGGTKRVFST